MYSELAIAGDDTKWSEWNNFRTASENAAPISFLYFGDAQNDIASLWTRVVRTAVLRTQGARFMVHAGDLVAQGYDERLWDEWTRALGFVTAMLPGRGSFSKMSDLWYPANVTGGAS